MIKDWIFISWEHHRRTLELSKAFHMRLFVFVSLLPKPFNYIFFLFETFILLVKIRPKGVIVQNPSIVLTFFCVLIKRIFKYKIISDTHNAGLIPHSTVLKKINFIFKYVQKHSDLVIVTNNSLKQIVKNNGGKPFVLPDIIPEFPQEKVQMFNKNLVIVYICSYSEDEPYKEVFEAAKLVPENITLYVTGDYRKVPALCKETLSANVMLCGFLDEDEYETLLSCANIVIDLTERENCLVCGAYEAISLNKPMILSDTNTLKNYFNLGAIYTKHKPAFIAEAIQEAIKNRDILQKEVTVLKVKLLDDWKRRSQKLLTIMNELDCQ